VHRADRSEPSTLLLLPIGKHVREPGAQFLRSELVQPHTTPGAIPNCPTVAVEFSLIALIPLAALRQFARLQCDAKMQSFAKTPLPLASHRAIGRSRIAQYFESRSNVFEVVGYVAITGPSLIVTGDPYPLNFFVGQGLSGRGKGRHYATACGSCASHQ